MSGLEVLPLVLAGVSAAAGLVSASSDARRHGSTSSSSQRTVTTTNRNESSASRQVTYTHTRGPAEAYASQFGSYSRSTTGGSAMAGSSWASKSSGSYSKTGDR